MAVPNVGKSECMCFCMWQVAQLQVALEVQAEVAEKLRAAEQAAILGSILSYKERDATLGSGCHVRARWPWQV